MPALDGKLGLSGILGGSLIILTIEFSCLSLILLLHYTHGTPQQTNIHILGVERNQYQDNLQGQEFLHIHLEQVHVQGIQIQVPEFLAGKSSEKLISMKKCQGIFFPCAFHLEMKVSTSH